MTKTGKRRPVGAISNRDRSRLQAAPTGARTTVSPKALCLPYQRAEWDDKSRFKIYVQSRQTGKDFETSGEVVEDCLLDPGTGWACLSGGERQSLEWLGKAKDWSLAYKLGIEEYAEDRDMAEAVLKSAEIRFANGSSIIALPANPKTIRGYSRNIVLQEFAYHEDPDAVWAAIFPSVTNPLSGSFLEKYRALVKGEKFDLKRKLRMIVASTFNGKDNKFFQIADKAKELGFSKHVVTIHDAVRDGLDINIEELKRALDDADAWAQEYECLPTDTSNVLLPYDLIALAESADATEYGDPTFFSASGNAVFCGIDFGRQNDPTVCWTLELIGDTLWTREVLVLKRIETPDQVDILRQRIRRAQRVSFDYTGPGLGMGDYLKKEFQEWKPEKHQFGKIELCTFTQKFKQELFPKLRRKFEPPTKLRVPVSRVVREDLHAMQQVVTNGTYNYWAPHTREGHSDRCTALALAVRAAGDGTGGGFITTAGLHIGRSAVTA